MVGKKAVVGRPPEVEQPMEDIIRTRGRMSGLDAATLERVWAERLAYLCRGECYHPSDQRRPITRVEVVRRVCDGLEPLVKGK